VLAQPRSQGLSSSRALERERTGQEEETLGTSLVVARERETISFPEAALLLASTKDARSRRPKMRAGFGDEIARETTSERRAKEKYSPVSSLLFSVLNIFSSHATT